MVLTHFSDELGVEWVRAEGARGFGAPVDAAHDGAVYELKSKPVQPIFRA